MMFSWILPLLVLLPLVAGLGLLAARRWGLVDAVGEAIGVAAALAMVLLSMAAWVAMDPIVVAEDQGAVIAAGIEFAPQWLVLRLPAVVATDAAGWQLGLGLDGIGLSMVLLASIVTFAVLLVSRSTVTHDRSDFAAWTLLAAAGLMLVFTSMDLVLFYIGFEFSVIPLFALIAYWGDRDAGIAAKRFVLYTLAGSIPMVLGILAIAQLYAGDGGWTVGFEELSRRAAAGASDWQTGGVQGWILALLVLGLGIKMALLPFHTWLPNTYGSCHATAAAFLAAVVSKLGLFGFVRLALPMVPLACEQYGPTVLASLGAIAIVVGALMALAQTDLRRLLAYSSLSHVGFVTMGLFALNEEGIGGGVLQMFNHGITTAAVFLAASCLIARRGTAQLDRGSRGLASRYPQLSAWMIFFLAAAAGVPGLNHFVGETLTLIATIARQPLIAAVAALGIILGAWYAFRLIQNLLFGPSTPARTHDVDQGKLNADIGARERWAFGLLAFVCLVIGVYPESAVGVIRRDAQRLGHVSDVVQNSHLALNSAEPNP